MRALRSEAVSRQRATCFTRTGQTLTRYDTNRSAPRVAVVILTVVILAALGVRCRPRGQQIVVYATKRI